MQIPEGVNVKIENGKMKVSGKHGEVERMLPQTIGVSSNGKEVEFKGEKMLVNTFQAHFRNAFKGVSEGYKRKLKIIFAHFPITLEIKGKDISIKNFLGEKQVRKANIVGNVKIEVKGQEVFVSGCSKDDVGATIGNIRTATKIRNKDGRVFQDGFYVIE
jgi:large subunit ribosomal protein L6